MKLAIVHDYLNQYGGAERVVESLNRIFPGAPIYTTIYIPENMPDSFRNMDIRTSFMQKFPYLKTQFKMYLMFYPRAIESFDLSDYEVILSSSSAFAKGVKKNLRTLHICYCYTPMRFVWDYQRYIAQENLPFLVKNFLPVLIKDLKKWDLAVNRRVDYFIGISRYIQQKIKESYQREAELIYPPVKVKNFIPPSMPEDFFLVVSRLNAYKRIDLVIQVFNRLNLPLKIIGTGPYRPRLERLIQNKKIEFLGKVSEQVLHENYARCRALIFPGEEDFGIVPVEVQSYGRPVIAYARGGALETVIDGITGLFFTEPTVDSLFSKLKIFLEKANTFNSKNIRQQANRFSEDLFQQRITDFIVKKYIEFKT